MASSFEASSSSFRSGGSLLMARRLDQDLAESTTVVRPLPESDNERGGVVVGGERELLSSLGMGASQLAWSDDGARILVVAAQLPDPSQNRVFVIDTADNAFQTLDEGESTPSERRSA